MLLFALVAVLTALVMTIVLAYVWEGQFRGYTRENMQRLAQSTADTLSQEYRDNGGWTSDALDLARSASSASSDIAVQVLNERGESIYDDTWIYVHRQQLGDKDNPSNPPSLMPQIEANADAMVTANVTDRDGRVVGEVRMWAFGSEALLTRADSAFRTNSYAAIAYSALVAVLLAFVMGSFASRSLTRPIRRITSTAAQIRGGDLTARTGLTGDDEIGRLGETFDSMATTLERDIKFEHRLTSDVAHERRAAGRRRAL